MCTIFHTIMHIVCHIRKIMHTHTHTINRLALDLAEHSGVSLPTTEAANQVYVRAIQDQQAGDEDFCAVIKTYSTI